MKSKLIVAFALATVALVVAIAAIASPSPAVRVDRPEKGAGAQVTTVKLIQGRVVRRMRAVVLTDTRCNPDPRGYSHCLNWMRLQNGRRILAVHVHRMSEMPCLSPGEHVILHPVSS